MTEQSNGAIRSLSKKRSSRLTAIERLEATVRAIKDGYVRTFSSLRRASATGEENLKFLDQGNLSASAFLTGCRGIRSLNSYLGHTREDCQLFLRLFLLAHLPQERSHSVMWRRIGRGKLEGGF